MVADSLPSVAKVVSFVVRYRSRISVAVDILSYKQLSRCRRRKQSRGTTKSHVRRDRARRGWRGRHHAHFKRPRLVIAMVGRFQLDHEAWVPSMTSRKTHLT